MPLLGWFLINLGGILKFCLPKYVDIVGLFFLVAGGNLVFATLRRSMVPGMARLFCAGFAFELGAMMVAYPPMGQSLFPWMVMLALIVGIVGPMASLRARKNAYGVLLATIWVLLLGAIADAVRAREVGNVVAYLLFAGGLGGITHYYSRWVKGIPLPLWMTEWYSKLPEEESVSLEAADASALSSSSKAGDALGHIQATGRAEQSL